MVVGTLGPVRCRAMAAVGISCVVAGCGGGHVGTDVEEALVAAGAHAERAEGAWLLAEAEYDQADLKADQTDAAKDPGEISPAVRQDRRFARRAVRHVHRVERRCDEGPGPEPCLDLGQIKVIVKEMTKRTRRSLNRDRVTGPDRPRI
jgi:hypothetical protein